MAVHQCARYIHNPRHIHEVAVKRIVQYLLGTKVTREGQTGYCGMVINPTDDLTLECFVDATFSGLWGHENDQDPSSVKSCTGFVLTLGGTPILWISKLQSEVTFSTMEAKYIALVHSMHELLPARWLLEELSKQLELDRELLSTVFTVWEDNNGALALANMPITHITPCSKHIGVKYHWFRSWINEPINGIVVQHINSKEQKGYILTKLLGRLEFSDKRKMHMG
eukprot:15095783-Ditylum_brightwellii.AAC.1